MIAGLSMPVPQSLTTFKEIFEMHIYAGEVGFLLRDEGRAYLCPFYKG
jgi:hypothetical protein